MDSGQILCLSAIAGNIYHTIEYPLPYYTGSQRALLAVGQSLMIFGTYHIVHTLVLGYLDWANWKDYQTQEGVNLDSKVFEISSKKGSGTIGREYPQLDSKVLEFISKKGADLDRCLPALKNTTPHQTKAATTIDLSPATQQANQILNEAFSTGAAGRDPTLLLRTNVLDTVYNPELLAKIVPICENLTTILLI